MFLVFRWSIIQWLIIVAGIVLLILKIAGVMPWLPWWVFVIPVVMAYPQLIVIGVVALVGWLSLKFARGNSSSGKWSDK